MRAQAEFFVYTLAEIQALWDANPYNATGAAPDIRAHQVTDAHRDAWHKL